MKVGFSNSCFIITYFPFYSESNLLIGLITAPVTGDREKTMG